MNSNKENLISVLTNRNHKRVKNNKYSINNYVDNKKPLLLIHVDKEEVGLQIKKDLQECFVISDRTKDYEKNLQLKRAE